jgi:hypothetical protein
MDRLAERDPERLGWLMASVPRRALVVVFAQRGDATDEPHR